MRKTTLCLCLLICLTHTLLYHSLQSEIQLKEGDEVLSTLGMFKISLISNDCSLNFYQFKESSQAYEPMNNKYSGNYQGSCQWLTIQNHQVITDTGRSFLALPVDNYTRTYLIVDDTNTLRLIGIKTPSLGLPAVDFAEVKFSNYSQSSQFIKVLEAFETVASKFTTPITTQWIFYFTQSTLTISTVNNSLTQSFNLTNARFSQSGFFDPNNETFPYTVFDGMIYGNLCGNKNQLRGPFVVKVSQFWPVVTIYDQQGYKVFQYALGNSVGSYNPCPQDLFLLVNTCVRSCPASYFHELKGNRGECKLNCESSSKIDNKTRICNCPNQVNNRQKYTCANSSSYIFGCFCSNNTFLSKNTQRCIERCGNREIGNNGLCLACPRNCQTCAITQNSINFITCMTCIAGYTLARGNCLQPSVSCVPNCLLCSNGTCLACAPLYSLLNSFCIQSCPTGTQLNIASNLSSICQPQSSVIMNACPLSCLRCVNVTVCLVCKPNYMLVVSPVSNQCIRKTLLFSCQSPVYSSLGSSVCYSNHSTSLPTLSKCNVANCFLCVYQSTSTCVACRQGLYLQDNTCVRSCATGFYQVNQACLPSIQQCKVVTFEQNFANTSFNLNTVTQSQIYMQLTQQNRAPLNQPYGYQLFARRYYSLVNDFNNINGLFYWSRLICAQCENGYGLTSDHTTCIPCSEGCMLCLYAYDGSCIANTSAELMLYSLGMQLSSCSGFIINGNECSTSCPKGTIPMMNSTYNKLQCLQPGLVNAQANADGYIKIDGSSFQVASDKYIHKFVFSQPITNKLAKGRLMQNTRNGSLSSDGSVIIIQSNQPTAILNLSGIVQNYQSVNNLYPADTVIGVSAGTSFRAYLAKDYAFIGYFFSIAIILTHCIFIGNSFMYKTDNLIIFTQCIFYFLFIRQLSSNPVAQFYFGWSWMHINFFPNYFSSLLTSTANTVPPYALYNLDTNFIRNAGSSLSLLFTFALIWAIISLICYIVDIRLGAYEIWFGKISKNSLLALLQLLSVNIFYWGVAYGHYNSGGSDKDTYVGLSALFIIFIVTYTCARTYFDKIAGAYMIKRIVYTSVLGTSYGKLGFVVILIIFQIIFAVFRYWWEKPASKRQKVVMVAQTAVFIIGMVILYLSTNVIATTYLLTPMIYLWYLALVVDLVDIYLASKNKILDSSWLPCLSDLQDAEQKGSSKQDIQQGGTDRPFKSNISN